MDAQQAFLCFVQRCLVPEKARRLTVLCASRKGQRKILAGLHALESAVRPAAVVSAGYGALWDMECYVFHEKRGFGIEFATVREAHDALALEDGWLILLRDGSAGIHRPEAPRWDREMLVVG